MQSMLTKAINTAARMGLHLREGDPVEALGNCLLESVKSNIDDRDIFEHKLDENIATLRENCVEEGEQVIGASPYRIEDFTDEEWHEGWQQMKHSGVWNVEYFGDLMIIALAHHIRKNILLINTETGSAPVTVVLGDRFGQPLDSEHPVILAYSGCHYESLIPLLDRDEDTARRIVRKYINGEDLFSDNNDTTDNMIQSRTIQITKEKSPPSRTSVWRDEQPRLSSPSLVSRVSSVSLSGEDDLDKTGVDTWRQYHPDSNRFSNNVQWSNNRVKTVSIPITISHD